jgi:hypothetical protein
MSNSYPYFYKIETLKFDTSDQSILLKCKGYGTASSIV